MSAEWTILYHGTSFKGRAEFLRLMLEDAQAPYVGSNEQLYGPAGLMDAFRGTPEAVRDNHGAIFPLFYPPAIWHQPGNGEEPVMINQVGACMIYLGEKLGYSPKTSPERARANSVLLNALDYMSEGRMSFHPVNSKMSYKDQKEEGDKASKSFSETRLKMFLYHFNKVVAIHGSKMPVAGGSSVTYADFALLHVLDATVYQFNKEFYNFVWDNLDLPDLKDYYLWMKSRPHLQAYFASPRCPACAGDSMM